VGGSTGSRGIDGHRSHRIRLHRCTAAATTDSFSHRFSHLATIRARTLIVTGDRDPLYPLEIFVEQYRAIPAAALHVLPNGGHDAVFGLGRAEFVRSALAFLQS